MGWFSKLWPVGPKPSAGGISSGPEQAPSNTPSEPKELGINASGKQEDNHDEDGMMDRLRLHRDVKKAVMARLRAEGIACSATTGHDANGDILIVNRSDVPRVQEIIRSLNS